MKQVVVHPCPFLAVLTKEITLVFVADCRLFMKKSTKVQTLGTV